MWEIYVIQSNQVRYNRQGQVLPGFFYVGSTTDIQRRLREHNGLYADGSPGNPKGGKYTAKWRDWELRAIYGDFENRSAAFRAEMALKHSKRSVARCHWSTADSPWCRGLGAADPRIAEINEALRQLREKYAVSKLAR
jgi:predicted GIY-YIG superfamily endonuclease